MIRKLTIQERNQMLNLAKQFARSNRMDAVKLFREGAPYPKDDYNVKQWMIFLSSVDNGLLDPSVRLSNGTGDRANAAARRLTRFLLNLFESNGIERRSQIWINAMAVWDDLINLGYKMPTIGVYLSTRENRPGMLKIGMSARNSIARSNSQNLTLRALVTSSGLTPRQMEKVFHLEFDCVRTKFGKETEWFGVSLQAVLEYAKKSGFTVELITEDRAA